VVAERGEKQGVREMRKHLAWYVKGLPGAAALRARIMAADTRTEVEGLLADYEKTLAEKGLMA
ncbi:MAG TPA: tRNA dihydrouridine synthase DusB, partial [Firmicutes bacterium]|nr:tRNA dihydrouridine synthase DusB [Bacillota bacterium]